MEFFAGHWFVFKFFVTLCDDKVMATEQILVIDDSREIVNHLCERLLPSMGYRVSWAFNGRTGLELIYQKKPDLVMLDLNLPEMTGMDVLRQMARESLNIPVILMTGYGSEKSAIEAFRLGIKDYIIKPFTAEEVSHALNNALVEGRLRNDNERLMEDLRRLENEARQRQGEEGVLLKMSQKIHAFLAVEQILDQTLEAAFRLSEAEQCTIWLPDPGRAHLRPYSKTAKGDKVQLPHVIVNESEVGDVFLTGKVIRRAMFSGQGIKIRTGFLARTILHVPLAKDERVVGVLSATNHEAPRAFSQQNEVSLMALASQAAIALENARLHQMMERKLKSRASELEGMTQLAGLILTSPDLNQVVRLVVGNVQPGWQVAGCGLWLCEPERQQLRLLAGLGPIFEQASQNVVASGKGVVGRVLATGQGVIVNDPGRNPVTLPPASRRVSAMALPLFHQGQLIGVLELVNKKGGPFVEQDIERLRPVTNAVTIALYHTIIHRQLESTQELLYAALEYTASPVFVVDGVGQLQLWNQQAQIWLRGRDDMRGRPVTEVITRPVIAQLLTQPLPDQPQYQEIGPIDDRYWLAAVAVVPNQGRILVCQDITYPKDSEKERTDFLAKVTHDLRAPLNSVIGFAAALEQVGPLNEQQNLFINHIINSTQRMLHLISNLLDLAKINVGAGQNRRPCDLIILVNESILDLQGQAMFKGMKIKFNHHNYNALLVMGDNIQLRRAISNLIDNAIKYSPAGQDVIVTLQQKDDQVQLMIKDSGQGIAIKDLPHIFEPFYRANNLQEFQGSGLGLALVRSIAEIHTGRIQVESKEGQGSCFTLQLPLIQKETILG